MEKVINNVLSLYDHNINSYKAITKQLEKFNVASIVHATGTGKSYNALQLAYDNNNKKILYIVPSNSIIEHLKGIIDENDYLDFERDFSNLNVKTYQWLAKLNEEDIKKLNIDILILDEFHHIGAPIWGQKVKSIIENHKDIKVLGMTAYTVRDRGTEFERDMTNSNTEELFSNTVVSKYDLCDAMIDGVLPKPIYKSAYINLEKMSDEIEIKLNKMNQNSSSYKELSKLLKDIKQRLHEAPSVKDIFKTNIKRNGKYIYFCPFNAENGINDIEKIMITVKEWLYEMGLNNDEFVLYQSTSELGKIGKKNREAFYNDTKLDGTNAKDKLRIMFAINQYNEGVHAPGLDGVIMSRSTKSDIVFFEQLGRALSVRSNTKEEYDKLISLPMEELKKICDKRDINIDENISKEELVEKLLSPVIIDLANNIDFIKNLENNLKNKVSELKLSNSYNKRINHLSNTSFDITMINENLFKILKNMSERLKMTWKNYYDLAKIYFKQYGNLNIQVAFKTFDGINYDEYGYPLGCWIRRQRQAYNKMNGLIITEEQIELLNELGINWYINIQKKSYINYFNLAKAHYEYYGNLEIPYNFKTSDGINYDENGINLWNWIHSQRKGYHGTGGHKLTENEIKLLESIGMKWKSKDLDSLWMNYYNMAKAYLNHYGNLDIKQSSKFRTLDGINYDENGILLGTWIQTQFSSLLCKGRNNMNFERIKLLKELKIGFDWISLKREKNLQEEIITDKNTKQKNCELRNRTYSLLLEYDQNSLPSKEEINNDFIKKLTLHKKISKNDKKI